MKTTPRAFSLVEVALALAIVSFAMLAVMGLLPVGLQSVKNAAEQASAANVVNTAAEALRQSVRSPGGSYVFSFLGNHTLALQTYTWGNLTLEGFEDPPTRRLAVAIQVHQLPSDTQPGRATVSAAWSALSPNMTWSASAQKWNNADGSVTTGIQFLPRP